MIHCTNCGHVNAEGASQCEACYDTLPALTSCPTCQTSVPDDAFFCPQCGASLPRGVSNQGDPSPLGTAENPSPLPPPAYNDLPPTNVVAHQALGGAPVPITPNLPPTNVVTPVPSSSDLPPTNVVNVPPPPPVDLPPTNVVNVPPPPPVDLPPTNVVNVPPPVEEPLPPTNVVNLGTPPTPAPYVADTIPPQSASEAAPTPEVVDEIETVPTMVVSPGSNSGFVEPPIQDVTPEPSNPPFVPPTIPPEPPPNYQSPSPSEPPPVESAPVETPPPLASQPPEIFQEESPVPNFETQTATTVQPFSEPSVGETLIQLPPARLIHERTNTNITLPPNLNVILIGKTTDKIEPDIDVSEFLDSDVVSRRHAAMFVEPNGYFIEDLGSSNGTYVNDVLCGQDDRVQVKPGDRICLGRENKVAFIFQIG